MTEPKPSMSRWTYFLVPAILICVGFSLFRIEHQHSAEPDLPGIVIPRPASPITLSLDLPNGLNAALHHQLTASLVAKLPGSGYFTVPKQSSGNRGPVTGPFGFDIVEGKSIYVGDIDTSGALSVIESNWRGKSIRTSAIPDHRYGGVGGAIAAGYSRVWAALPTMPRIESWQIGRFDKPLGSYSVEFPAGKVPHSVDALWAGEEGAYALLGSSSGGYHADSDTFCFVSVTGQVRPMNLSRLTSQADLLQHLCVSNGDIMLLADTSEVSADGAWDLYSFYPVRFSLADFKVPVPIGYSVMNVSPLGRDRNGDNYAIVDLIRNVDQNPANARKTLWKMTTTTARLIGTMPSVNLSGLRDGQFKFAPSGSIYCVAPLPSKSAHGGGLHFGLYKVSN